MTAAGAYGTGSGMGSLHGDLNESGRCALDSGAPALQFGRV